MTTMFREEGKSVQRARTIGFGLLAIMALAHAVILSGCSEDIQEAGISEVRNQSFTFSSGAVFHPALANMMVTLSFSDDPVSFTLSSVEDTAAGLIRFAPCILTVTSSSYAVGAGPQSDDEIRLALCDFDSANDMLIVGNGTTTAISAPGVPL